MARTNRLALTGSVFVFVLAWSSVGLGQDYNQVDEPPRARTSDSRREDAESVPSRWQIGVMGGAAIHPDPDGDDPALALGLASVQVQGTWEVSPSFGVGIRTGVAVAALRSFAMGVPYLTFLASYDFAPWISLESSLGLAAFGFAQGIPADAAFYPHGLFGVAADFPVWTDGLASIHFRVSFDCRVWFQALGEVDLAPMAGIAFGL
jgi:hypothetical protein